METIDTEKVLKDYMELNKWNYNDSEFRDAVRESNFFKLHIDGLRLNIAVKEFWNSLSFFEKILYKIKQWTH